MARLDKDGFLRGRLGNNVYKRVGNHNIATSKPQGDHRNSASRSASSEFGLISNTATAVKKALEAVFNWHDGGMGNRLVAYVSKVITKSETGCRGERDFHDGDLSQLCGFQFNNRSELGEVLKVRPKLCLDQNGSLDVTVPKIDNKRDILYPKSSLPVKCSIRFDLLLFNFRRNRYQVLEQIEYPLKGTITEPVSCNFDFTIPDGAALLVFMSLQYYINDSVSERKSINAESFNPVELIGAYQFWGGRTGTREPLNMQKEADLPGYEGKWMVKK